MKVLCDTNVFIRLMTNDPEVIGSLTRIGDENILMPSITVMELYAGMRKKEELQRMKKQVKHYHIQHLDARVSQKAVELMKDFRLSHGLTIPDALIGAMAIVNELNLYTYNLKDFRYSPGIQLFYPV